jgi:putative ABC transport system permease protein
MLSLAAQMLRHRKGSVVATFVALTAGVMILMACGLLFESGLRYHGATQRYAGADAVVTDQELSVTGKEFGGDTVTSTVALPEGGSVPATLVEKIAAVPGVATAVGDRSITVDPLTSSAPQTSGHGWSSAALAPYKLVSGAAPKAEGEIAVDKRVAGTGLRPGSSVKLLVAGTVHEFRVSGVVQSGKPASGSQSAAVFFTDEQATEFSLRPELVDAVGVIAEPGADQDDVVKAVGAVASAAGAKAYSGVDVGLVEQSDATDARSLLVQAGSAFGGYVATLVVFVVAGTVGLSVRHRRRDLALLRAIAATPGQVRKLILTEVGLLALVSAAIGVPAGIFATIWTRGQLIDRGFVPESFTLSGGYLAGLAVTAGVILVALASAWAAAWRTTKIRPTEALGEISVEPTRSGRVRLIIGLVCLLGGLSLTTISTAASGPGALGAAIGMLYTFVLAVALLAPWINRAAATAMAPLMSRVWGTSGYLAAANLRANAQGMVSVLTALVLSVGFGGSVWFLQDNLERQTLTQSRDGMLAQWVLKGAGGLPDTAAADARKTPGVVAATGVQSTSVIVKTMGELSTAPAQGIDVQDAARTMDLKVRSGNLNDLTPESVAVSSSSGLKMGDRAELWLGDGTPVKLRVAAIYDRGFGFGDVTLNSETLAGHTRSGLDDRVLIRTDPGTDASALAALTDRYPGSSVVSATELNGQLAEDVAISAWLNKLLIAVMVAYAVLAAANTMVIAALARRRELSLLRLVGVTRRQVKRMVHAEQAGLLGVALAIGGAIAVLTLSSIMYAIVGQRVPYVPALGWVTIVGGTVALAMFATVIPVNRLLRIAPVEGVGAKE